ncbi:NmrA/HSCARG family protein [Actinoplanes sp. N902-109]|uniref:NmrA/HSCARG family protein n=1 Tax=Actinoplanes sp. (strain N902-109) TaxID=649831 RepID=UPI0003294919|nr:NmrA/HSCARG family protein [Actinoplanes sp. N902-109]AGL15960.1 NmrA family protein [Actinoplanes sp. N902-109]
MANNDKTILVIGATGNQGGATTTRLLADGWRVRAMTRDPAGPAAAALAAAGAEVVAGDMAQPATLLDGMRGVYGVFSVQPTQGSAGTPADFTVHDEIRWGRNVADAAKAMEVSHFVYASVGGAERGSGVPNVESKWSIEQHIAELELPATVLRPVSFMEMCASPFFLRDGKLMLAIRPEVPWQLVAAADVGHFAALAFARPGEFVGKAIEIAGDSLTPPQLAAAIREATGHDVPYVPVPVDALRQINPDGARAFDWLNDKGYQADIDALRALHPDLMSFDTWLARVGKEKVEAALTR